MWRDTHPPQQGIEMVHEITALNSSHLDLPRACPPFIFPLILQTWNRMGEDLESNRFQVERTGSRRQGRGVYVRSNLRGSIVGA